MKIINGRWRPWRAGLVPAAAIAAATILSAGQAQAVFDSGSVCPSGPTCLGAFSPTVDTVIQLPPDGILDYTTFTVPQQVTVTFTKNAANTPVVIRTSGDVAIRGYLDVLGDAAKDCGTYGDGKLGDDGQPGKGGPGGFDGGFGGMSANFGGSYGAHGSPGHGPGGGQGGYQYPSNQWPLYGRTGGGSGGGSQEAGSCAFAGWGCTWADAIPGGVSYGQASLLPLVGGSGGGGGTAGSSFNGCGGGGGGGAVLIASSTSITVQGHINADGGRGGYDYGQGAGGAGGGGAAGSIRLVSESVWRDGNYWWDTRGWWMDSRLYARRGGGGYNDQDGWNNGGYGGYGWIRIEANNTNWSGYTDPGYSFGLPGPLSVPNTPSLVISKVAGVAVPANPTGSADVTLPQGTAMPVTVEVAGVNIPRGTTVTVRTVPSGANATSTLTTALDGLSDAATTATASVTLGDGNNVLIASATYTVTQLIAMNLPTFNGERVAKVRVETEMGKKGTKVTYITASGKEYPAKTGVN
ncbi:MAG: hypothetical protein HY894_06130 [Deltaproteobacteria bacterium]|nr:hypothetical protein [Deltaproteobacteria bacterium]